MLIKHNNQHSDKYFSDLNFGICVYVIVIFQSNETSVDIFHIRSNNQNMSEFLYVAVIDDSECVDDWIDIVVANTICAILHENSYFIFPWLST